MFTSIINVGSQTKAIKAQRILRDTGITSEIIKSDKYIKRQGCSYALRIKSYDINNAISILRQANISYEVSEHDTK